MITTPEVSAVRDADRVIGLLNTRGIKPIQLVLNRVRPKMMANQDMLAVDDVTDILALPLLGLVLEDEQVIVSTNRGEPLTLNGEKDIARTGLARVRGGAGGMPVCRSGGQFATAGPGNVLE